MKLRLIPATGVLLVTAAVAVWASGINTTINDFKLPGSQPNQSGTIQPPSNCAVCHGNYDSTVEPYFNWRGSMMAQAARDPIFFACLAIANQDAAQSGDLCIRCHSPRAWLGGRSVPTDGSALTADDRHGVQCGFCHKLVEPSPIGVNPHPGDPNYTANTYPQDQTYLGTLAAIPNRPGSGTYVVDSNNTLRGPFTDPFSQHQSFYSPFHRESALCGTCHDVSNPALSRQPDGTWAANALDTPPPDPDPYTHFPVERTFSEWQKSAYNTPTGIYAPQFGGNRTYVRTCQDCHMRAVTGVGCNRPGTPVRTDLPLHDLTGGNTFVPKLVAQLYPSEVDTNALNAGILRARAMLQKAATLNLTVGYATGGFTARVRVTNETGHKLPSGYPEGRRMWLNLKAYDDADQIVYESGAYDPVTAVLTHDPAAKVYEAELGMSAAQAALAGLSPGVSFHFVLNNMIMKDNRIPPRGFTNAAFDSIQAMPVGAIYADGQYWDDTDYTLPISTRKVTATLLYQTISKEYIEFLRDENVTNSAGITAYNLWATNGKSTPEVMATVTQVLDVVSGVDERAGARVHLAAVVRPGRVELAWAQPAAGPVTLHVFDVQGRSLARLLDGAAGAGAQVTQWDTRHVPAGLYLVRLTTSAGGVTRKVRVSG